MQITRYVDVALAIGTTANQARIYPIEPTSPGDRCIPRRERQHPNVREQMELIQELQSNAWWEDVTVPMLKRARKRLRALVRLIEKTQRQPIYTDFEDELGPETIIEISNFGSGSEFDRFRAKARQFLVAHKDHLTIHKLRFNTTPNHKRSR
ncbi:MULTISPECIES: hypothetical protein [Trichocoleus]|uniref:Uncharacterized protein n=1 Tax=Trichocoleus desertorum GB2-A4 TaxID=2933944 RepID=A0ABV0JG73_9CYAN|nr:hypothetical protein [Trichocoleus sp. FACHB-46]MBD1865262.1 hypothetical protein [Trichocoleus sp. FACHB-46]